MSRPSCRHRRRTRWRRRRFPPRGVRGCPRARRGQARRHGDPSGGGQSHGHAGRRGARPRAGDLGVGGPRRPGIVHRLDKGTSGLIVLAKTRAAYDSLTAQLGRRSMSRRYLCLAHGVIRRDEGVIDAAIARDPRSRVRMAVARPGHGQARGHALPCPRALPGIHLPRVPARDRAHPPDPCSPRLPGSSAGRRRDLRGPEADETRCPRPDRGAGRRGPPRRGALVPPSRDRRAP